MPNHEYSCIGSGIQHPLTVGREITSVGSSGMVSVIGGRFETLGELAIAYDEDRLIDVLENSGGISYVIPAMVHRFDKSTHAHIIYAA